MLSNPTLIELRPQRSLLNSEFDGYKLTLSPIPTITEQLKIPVDRQIPDVNQYSFLHAKLYALHNHLVGETDETESVYFVDKELNVQKFTIDQITSQFSSVTLWQMPLRKERGSGEYNVSLKLASSEIAVMGDGMGYLYILDRGCRAADDTWTVLFSGDVTGSEQKVVIADVVYRDSKGPELNLLLTTIIPRDSTGSNSTVLYWITFVKSETWNQVALRQLTVNGFVQYANLERTCEAVYVVSDATCRFTLDSENEISESEEPEVDAGSKYKWTQKGEDITIRFPFHDFINKNLVNIKAEASNIEVKYNNEILLKGPLHKRIDSDMTTWTVENTVLEVVLEKSESGQMWPEIVEGDRLGEYLPDPGVMDEITERLAPFTSETEVSPPTGTTFNSQQVEECDFECDRLTVFERLSKDIHRTTHKANIGSHQVLLTVGLERGLPPAFAVRNDVDACIWQPTIQGDGFSLEHRGTILAMGYIQASKQQMKFFTCSPDLNYSVICESSKHIFIYCQNKSISSGELRNRTTGKRVNKLAQQQLHNLLSNDEILGVYASNSYLYILGESFITALKL